MKCQLAQEILLDALAGQAEPDQQALLEDHLAGCEACREFAGFHEALDRRLSESLLTPSPNAEFRTALRGRLMPQPRPWPEVFPDIAHLLGCVLAVLLLSAIMPQYSRAVLLAGSGFTAVTYFIQAVLRGVLEERECPKLAAIDRSLGLRYI